MTGLFILLACILFCIIVIRDSLDKELSVFEIVGFFIFLSIVIVGFISIGANDIDSRKEEYAQYVKSCRLKDPNVLDEYDFFSMSSSNDTKLMYKKLICDWEAK